MIAGYLLTGEVRNAVNLPYLDAKTSEQVKPYLPLGEALGKLLAQLSPASADRQTRSTRRHRNRSSRRSTASAADVAPASMVGGSTTTKWWNR